MARLIPDNPVLTKEMRVRMRGARAYWILFGYLGFLSFVVLSVYYGWRTQVSNLDQGRSDSSIIGQTLFYVLIITQMFLVLFITPAITSGSITLEKEQRTLEMLTMSRMPRGSIIAGKLLAAICFTALLLVSSLPLLSICFMLGSVDPAMLLSAYLMLLFGSFLVGAMGLMWSSIARNTTTAVLFTYTTQFLLFVFGAIGYTMRQVPFGADLTTTVFRTVGSVLFGPMFLGIHGIDGLGFVLTSLLAGILMAAVAMSRLEMFPERNALLLRGLALLLVGTVALAVDQWWIQVWYHPNLLKVAGGGVQPPIGVLIFTALLLMFIVPTYATGELKPYETRRFVRHLLWGWTPRGLSRGKLASGLPYLLILTLVCLGMYVVSFVLVGKPGDFATLSSLPAAPSASAPRQAGGAILVNGQVVRGAMPPGGFQSRNGVVHVPASSAQQSNQILPSNYTATIGGFPQAAVMLLSFVVGFSLLCLLLSVVFRNRWLAWLLAYVVLIFIWILPAQARSSHEEGSSYGIGIQVAYLDPIQSLSQMGDPAGYWQNNFSLPMGRQPMWLCTSEAWLLVGLFSSLALIPIVRRAQAVTGDLPYEEMVAEA